MLLLWDTLDDEINVPILQPAFILEAASFRLNSRDAPTARRELVIAVMPHMTDAINDIFSSIYII